LGTFGLSLWIPLLPLYFRGLGADAVMTGTVYTLGSAVFGLLLAPAGHLSDQYGRKMMIVVAGALSAASTFMLGVSNGWTEAALAYAVFNASAALLQPSLRLTVVESVSQDKRGTALGTFFAVSPSVAMIAPFVGGMVASTYGFKPLLLLSSALVLVTAVLRLVYLKETLLDRRCTNGTSKPKMSWIGKFMVVQRNRSLFTVFFAFVLYGAAMQLTGFLVPLFASDELGLSPDLIGVMYSISIATGALFAIPFGKLSDKMGRRKCVIFSWAGEIIAMFLFIFSRSPLLAVISFGLWSAAGHLDTPARTAWISELTRQEERGLVMGLFMSSTTLMSLPSPSIGGYLYSVSPRHPFYIDGILSLVALLAIVRLTREPKKNLRPAKNC